MILDGPQVGERFEAWQRRLEPLGVGHWRISVIVIGGDDSYPTARDAIASAGVSPHYNTVQFFVHSDYLETCESLRDLDETIVHEWLHVASRNLDEAVQSVEDWMPTATWEMFKDTIHHHREGEIEALARLIVALWYATSTAADKELNTLYRTTNV